MSSNPLVSVIMSVYNAKEYLKEAIKSILNQTYKNIEFIIINDGSTDNSLEIIKQYQKLDKRIVLINQENIGLTKSLNKAIKIAKGEYIARMDADDVSMLNRFEVIVDKFRVFDVAMIASRAYVNNDNYYKIIPKISDLESNQKELLKFYNIFIHGTFVFKADVIKKELYNEEYKYAQDYELILRFFEKNYKILYISDVLYFLRSNNNSISKKSSEKQNFYALKALETHIGTSRYFMSNKNIFLRVILLACRSMVK
jgi:glycosyltransferase involved in cell wall biosynthesis